MTVAVADRVLAAAPVDLRHSEQALLAALSRLAGPDGRLRWACGTAQLVRMTRYSEASIKRARRELVKRGLVRILRRGHAVERTEYAVVIPAQETALEGVETASPVASRPPRPVTVTPPYQGFPGTTPLPPTAAPWGGDSSPPCRRASRRGRPCASCRDCGTSPRALRRAAERARPPWCGGCDERTRQLDYDTDHPARCPACHPARLGAA